MVKRKKILVKIIHSIEFFLREGICFATGHRLELIDLPRSYMYQCKVCAGCFSKKEE